MLNPKTITIVSLMLCLSRLSLLNAMAQGPGGTVIVAQDGSGDYECIQSAIDDYSSTEIVVMPGRYTENILITKDITIKAYDGPLTTIIDGSRQLRWENKASGQTSPQSDGIWVNPAQKVVIQGLCVTNARHGIVVDYDAHASLKNCIFWANKENGIFISNGYEQNHDPTTIIYNCIAVDNGQSGILIGQFHYGSYDYCPPTTILGTITVANNEYGIRLAESDRMQNTHKITLNYNCSVANRTNNYGPGIGQNQTISEGANSFSLAPYFVDGNAGDFRLTPWSPCVDGGSPGAGFMDPDGTTNDMGAYGGPGAATFFESPIDGPMVREVTITPGAVAQGTTLTIHAKGSVR